MTAAGDGSVTEQELARLAAVGIYGPSDDDAAGQRTVIEQLIEQGVSVDDLVGMPRLGGLVLRAFQRVMQPGDRLTLQEIAARAGVPPDELLRVRRALGFGDPAPDERCFVPADADVMLFILGTTRLVGSELTMQMARAIGTAMSRIAEAEIALARSQVERRMETRGATVASILARYGDVLGMFLPAVLRAIDAVHRAHLVYLARRYSESAAPPSEYNVLDMVIGFADLTRSTAMVRELDLAGLDRALATFEDVTTDLIAAAGAILVKRLGDGVMFVTPQPQLACTLARRLVEAFRDNPAAPPARVGLAAGRVAALRGDFYGPAVHLAARIVTVAPPATVLMSVALRDRVPGVATRSAGLHALTGFGDAVELFALLP
jgi:class 3 adenylate cyclase